MNPSKLPGVADHGDPATLEWPVELPFTPRVVAPA